MSVLVGDKLYEKARTIKLEKTLQRLKEQVEFPDVRALVNQGSIDLSSHILEWRKPTRNFREWLQSESKKGSGRHRAYHNEIGKETGVGGLKRFTEMFGVFLGGGVGAGIGLAIDAAQGHASGPATMVGAGLGGVASSLAEGDRASRKPVIFNDW